MCTKPGLTPIVFYGHLTPIVSLPLALRESLRLALPHKVPTSASPSVPMKAVPMKRSRSSLRNHGRALVHTFCNALAHPALMPAHTLLDCWYPSCSRPLSPRLRFVSLLPTTIPLMPLGLFIPSPPLLLVWSTSPSSQARCGPARHLVGWHWSPCRPQQRC